MHNRIARVLALLCLWPALAAADPATDEAITATALDYVEGWYTADADRMRRSLHPEFIKQRVVTDVSTGEQSVLEIDADSMVRSTARGVGRDSWRGPLDVRVSILDQYDGMADVRVVSPLYVDYLHIVEWKGRWVILQAIWGPFGE